MDQNHEQPIINRAQTGDKEAFATLYRLYVGKIYAYIIVRIGTKQDAEDLTAQVFTKAYKQIKTFKQKSSFATWIYTITRNQLIDFYRSKKNQPMHLDLSKLPAKNPEAESSQLQAQKEKTTHQILAKLPENYRQVLKLRFLQNQTIKQTAHTLGISQANVKIRQLRALQKAQTLSNSQALPITR